MNSNFSSLLSSRRAFSLAIVIAFLAQSPCSSAADLFYSLTGGTLSGTLNDVKFTNASYTISATGNPANVQIGSINGFETHFLALTTTIAIDGFEPVVFTNSNFGIFSLLGDSGSSSSSGFAAYPDPTGFRILGIGAYVSLLVPDSTSGPLRIYDEVPFPTSGGDLIIAEAGYGGSPRFSITAVPEPGTTMLGAIGACVLGVIAIRRKRE